MIQQLSTLTQQYSQLFQWFQAFDQLLFDDSDVQNILHHQIVLLIRHSAKEFIEGVTMNTLATAH
jgi:hypothetical protein